MANRDNRKNQHNRGGYKSIGSQVGSALGGHLSKQGKLGGGKGGAGITSESGNFSFNDFANFVGNIFTKPGYANTMGQVTGNLSQLQQPSAWKIKQFADKNIDITKMNKSFKFDIDTQRAIQSIENDTVRNWLNKNTPQSVKDLKINHQLYSPTKVMPGDKGYNPTGTGSIKLDKETERYLEWMAKANPQGKTISDYEKLYARQLAEGRDLYTAMRFNPAETGNFYALIDDSEKENNTKNNTMFNELLTIGNKELVGHAGGGGQGDYGGTIKSTDPSSGPSDNQVKNYLGGLYQGAFNRDPEFNNDPLNTADYWIDAVSKGQHGDRDWKEWLGASIYGSDEYKGQQQQQQPPVETPTPISGGGGGGYSGPSLEDFQSMLDEMFSRFNSPWTPFGYGWGGTNSNGVRFNRSQASRLGTSYAGNKSSFNRSGSRLSQGTPWMNTLGE